MTQTSELSPVDREIIRILIDRSVQVSDAGPLSELFCRVLDLAAELPGGQHELIEGLKKCRGYEDAKAFCRFFTQITTVEVTNEHACHDDEAHF